MVAVPGDHISFNSDEPSADDARVHRVIGDSMLPLASDGDLVIVDPRTPRFGEIGVFQVGSRQVVHRVVWRSTDGGREMGDNARRARHYANEHVIGRVVSVVRQDGTVATTRPSARFSEAWRAVRSLARHLGNRPARRPGPNLHNRWGDE